MKFSFSAGRKKRLSITDLMYLQVDSDALAEMLKATYPECNTLRERKHRAAVDFLNAEISLMQTGNSITGVISQKKSISPSLEHPLDDSKTVGEVPLESRRVLSPSVCTSPSVTESSTSPRLAEPTSRGSQADSGQSHAPASPTNAQQFIWSAHNGQFMRPKTKRKMTVEERNAYKETRRRGACDKCRKQKGKVLLSYDFLVFKGLIDIY